MCLLLPLHMRIKEALGQPCDRTRSLRIGNLGRGVALRAGLCQGAPCASQGHGLLRGSAAVLSIYNLCTQPDALQVRPGIRCIQRQVTLTQSSSLWSKGLSMVRRSCHHWLEGQQTVAAQHVSCHSAHVMGQACGIHGQAAVGPCCRGQQCARGGSAQHDICPQYWFHFTASPMFQQHLQVSVSTHQGR